MKELTIEQKAKLYDEVVNKLKGFMAQGVDPLITRADVQDFFPELKESEDERIRRELIERFSHIKGIDWYGLPIKDILAWLEKQGEQKPVVIPKFRVGDFVKDANYHGEPTYEIVGMDGECYICQYRGNKSMGDRSVMHFCFDNPYLRLVEQKPVDLVAILKDYFANTPKEQQDKDWEELKHLNNFGWELIEQKPTWSEEEKKKLDRIYYILGIAADEHAYSNTCRLIGDKEAVELQDFLRSIAKPDKKPAEWSKEDEENFARVDYACIKVYGGDSYSSDWLRKFLGIHKKWKPSDEQMIELRRVISGCSYDIEPLVEIEEHLKKLKDE